MKRISLEMANSSDDDDLTSSDRFENLCRELNMDEETAGEAWSSYERISRNYTLEVRYMLQVVHFGVSCAFQAASCPKSCNCIRNINLDYPRAILYTGFLVPCTWLAGRVWYRPLIAPGQWKGIVCRLQGYCGRQN